MRPRPQRSRHGWLPLAAVVPIGCTQLISGDVLIPIARDAAVAQNDGAPRDTAVADSDTIAHDTVAAPDAEVTGCSWVGPLSFAPAEPLTAVNSPSTDSSPFVTRDGLELYFASTRPGGQGGRDIYLARRMDPAAAFGPPENVVALNSPFDEGGFKIAADGRSAYYASRRTGGAGNADIWIAWRDDLNVPFSAAQFVSGGAINRAGDEWDPFPSSDGLRLYFSGESFIDSTSRDDLLLAERTAIDQPFEQPVLISQVNAVGAIADGNPVLTADERVIVFSTGRSGVGIRELWYATRDSVDGPFAKPQPLTAINQTNAETEPFVSADGCWLYFSRPGPSADADLYRTQLLAP